MITVFTPVYNRADTIHRVWESLNSQEFKDFEWVVIDDGSTDDIRSVIERYKDKSPFDIVFWEFPENRGKHIATNKALELARGEFFIVADSDDAFSPDALSFFMDSWNEIPAQVRESFCGVRACCCDQLGRRVSDSLPHDPLDTTMLEAYFVHGFRKESWCMVLTSEHRKHLFPNDHIGHFFPEGVVWSSMTRNKLLRFRDKETRIYFTDSVGSLNSSKKTRSAKSTNSIITARFYLEESGNYFSCDYVFFVKCAILFDAYSIYERKFCFNFQSLRTTSAKLLSALLLPFSIFVAIYFYCCHLFETRRRNVP